MKKVHVLSNSHLDREHRHSFQETRLMLVEMMDDVIEIMENDPEYKFFTLDGQTIAIDDYLEVKPNMKERVAKLIKDGRLLIGPWYSLVDCYSVNPESIVRNLLIGHKVCREYGEPMKVGYSIFSFGQMAQLPQIYGGFGIDNIMFYKGSSAKVFEESEFFWIAPDGSKALATRLGKVNKRWNFFWDFNIPVLLGGDADLPGWEAKFTDDDGLCHLNDEKYNQTKSTLLHPDIRIREEMIKPSVERLLNNLKDSVSDNVFVGFDGTDFIAPYKEIPEALRLANDMLKGEVELVSSTPGAYFDDLRKDIDLGKLKEYTGEMRFGPVGHVHCETMGTNTELKLADFFAENTLINYAEPLSVIANAYGAKYPHEILELAWKYLFRAHAHDSIHGSGDPMIKPDNLYTLAQVQEIADAIVKRAVEGIASRIDYSAYDNDDIALTVFNTTPYERSDVMQITLDLPAGEKVTDTWIEDLDGNRVEIYKIGEEDFNLPMVHARYRPKSVYSKRYTFNVYAENIPAMGFKSYKIKRTKSTAYYAEAFPTGFTPYKPIGICGNVLDNGLVKVTILPNGTVDVYDYETKQSYSELNAFRDVGSCGDFWIHREPMINTIISSKAANAQIELVSNSGLMATYRVTLTLDIPEGLDGKVRSKHKIPTEIVTEITVKKDSKRIDFKTRLTNQSKDHMFVVDFPTGINAKTADWEAPFEIRKRDVDAWSDVNGKKSDELERQAMQNFLNVTGDKSAFAVFTKGIKEVGTKDEYGTVVTLTLFRSATSTFPIHNDLFISFDDEPSQALDSTMEFEYAVLLHNNEDVIGESRKFITPMLSAQVGVNNGGSIPNNYSFMSKSHKDLTLSALKANEDGSFVVRVYNPTDKELADTIKFGKDIASVQEVSLEEVKIRDLDVKNNAVKISVKPYAIMTLKVSV
ncbi:MAG: glycosyl hydrolase-related protein [Oscillospiraceae bacterium]|nr:glycosyl hydrolase-related protein [Oscillospiraceae bacterium]